MDYNNIDKEAIDSVRKDFENVIANLLKYEKTLADIDFYETWYERDKETDKEIKNEIRSLVLDLITPLSEDP